MVLDASFSAETMASALSIPASRNIIRRHLAAELDALTQVARYGRFAPETIDDRSPCASLVGRARYEQRARQARAERKRTEKLEPGAPGRSLSRSFTAGLALAGSHQDELYAFKAPADGQTNGFKSSVKTSLHVSPAPLVPLER